MGHDEHNDADLRKDDEALLERIEREKGKMYGIAYAYMRNEADALEAVQETVCRVWMKRRSLREPRYFATWMIRILIHVCMDERKKRKREQPSPNERLERAADSDRTIERIGMAEQIAKLPPRYRMVVVLKYYRDMTVMEIAKLLEKPDGTIRTWLHKALKQLRREMEQGKEGVDHERVVEEGWGRR
ncbi:sigma-70 family RNA polymerase sigma factor [Paenibacillus sp. 1011MAR3C5]|uniref:sigma-70 family RNA polymerase sigma factor n=1 Tax=Paenibacillus sp. 1011MAR3C5 TaxID=1675787 RepID=UPI000E6BEACF|nr:sigma-70 family RNA polymerase sigma factor [Paenibacillus sp. 1011MAR3C5]RJE82827.1 sigma-70 family RNA polymerase sigma factor [Paenibacillus sp. 1011MAR3C5]